LVYFFFRLGLVYSLQEGLATLPRDCTVPEARDHWYQCCRFWYFDMTSNVMFSDKFLMSDVLATNLMLTGLLFFFYISSHFRTKIS